MGSWENFERVASASREQIETWSDRVFDTRSVDEVLTDLVQ